VQRIGQLRQPNQTGLLLLINTTNLGDRRPQSVSRLSFPLSPHWRDQNLVQSVVQIMAEPGTLMDKIPSDSTQEDFPNLVAVHSIAGATLTAKRDNSYYGARLEREFPAVWADYQTGRYSSLRAACIEAGLIKPRKRSNELKNAWRKAKVDEKIQFLQYLKQEGVLRRLSDLELALPVRGPAMGPGGEHGGVLSVVGFPWRIEVGGRITPEGKELIVEIMRKRGLIAVQGQYHVGIIMKELGRGFKPQDPSLSHALKGGWRIRPELARALERWVAAHYRPSGAQAAREG